MQRKKAMRFLYPHDTPWIGYVKVTNREGKTEYGIATRIGIGGRVS